MVKSPVEEVGAWNVSTLAPLQDELCVEESKQASHSNDVSAHSDDRGNCFAIALWHLS